jgi:3-oxoacyl-[acyl-carrier protein] reductase
MSNALNMLDLSNKKALITGASGGIGKACAKTLHQLGAHVIITGTNLNNLELLGSELKDNYTIFQANLKNKEECHNLINTFDDLDILICNAGMTNDSLALRMKDEDFEDIIAINLTANFILMRGAIKGMIKKRAGRIITISSVVALSGSAGQVNYTASKGGLISMTKSFAREVASRGITVNSIAPGFITSQMTEKLSEEQKNAILSQIPLKDFGIPEDIANTAAFLASNAARYITGTVINVNGGMLMV